MGLRPPQTRSRLGFTAIAATFGDKERRYNMLPCNVEAAQKSDGGILQT